MDWRLFFSTFALVLVAELPDKTALATVLLAARGRAVPVFVGVAAAFVIQSAIAVIFGSALGKLPHGWVHLVAAVLFFVFAIVEWRKSAAPDEVELRPLKPGGEGGVLKEAWVSFAVIFVAEWGDLTQLATASLAARFSAPLTLFAAATLALWLVTALAIFAGHSMKAAVRPALLSRIAAVAFAGVGIYLLVDSLRSLAV